MNKVTETPSQMKPVTKRHRVFWHEMTVHSALVDAIDKRHAIQKAKQGLII